MILSVIIPVYNVEQYLRQCVDSVLNQQLQDYEIILVDDGSKDNSVGICDEYKKTHSNVIVIHKENGGSSSARNTGMKAASGKYIVFLDSDDWWNPDIDFRLILNRVSNDENVEMFLLSSVDYIEGEGVCLIEWAGLIDELLPEKRTEILIEKDLDRGFDYRLITRKEIDQ